MFELPNDPELNTALRDAIFSNARTIRDVVMFDWDRDGSYSHQFSDLSSVVVSVDLDRSKLTANQPEEINTTQGFSSSELSITLNGARHSDELPAYQLLSPYVINSPFRNMRITGIPVKYTKEVYTSLGTVSIPQFRGVIRDFSFNAASQDVNILCSDSVPWSTSVATLPHWAVNRYTYMLSPAGIDERVYTAIEPINAQWVISDLLFRAGTPLGPPPRPDCTLYITGNGSFIPSIGTIARSDSPWSAHQLHEDAVWYDGKFGAALMEGTQSYGIELENAHSDRTLDVQPDKVIGYSFWKYCHDNTDVRSNLGTGYHANGFYSYVDLMHSPPNSFSVQVTDNGQIFMTLYGLQNSGVETWEGYTESPLADGAWHHFDLSIRFPDGTTPTFTAYVDGSPVGLVTAGSTAVHDPYSYTDYEAYRVNDHMPVYMRVWGDTQYIQLYGGDDTYLEGSENPATMPEGYPYASVELSGNELVWLPDVTSKNVWETLKEVVGAEFGALYTDELGTLHFQRYSSFSPNTDNLGNPVETYSVEDLTGLVTNPSLDRYRNVIEIPYVRREAHKEVIYTPDKADDHPVSPNDEYHEYTEPLSEVISTDSDGFWMWNNPDWENAKETENYEYVNRSTMTACTFLASDPTDNAYWLDGYNNLSGWNSWSFPSDDCRSITLYGTLQAGGDYGMWMGAKAPNDDESPSWPHELGIRMRAYGMKYSDRKLRVYVAEDNAEVAEYGRSVLQLAENDWRQTEDSMRTLASQLIQDTTMPAPVIEDIEIVSDPRLQIGDVVTLDPEGSYTTSIRVQVLGIRRSATSNTDSIDARIIYTPSAWVLGDAEYSVLGSTTILGD